MATKVHKAAGLFKYACFLLPPVINPNLGGLFRGSFWSGGGGGGGGGGSGDGGGGGGGGGEGGGGVKIAHPLSKTR